MDLDLDSLEDIVAKFRTDYPNAGWRCAAHFSPYMKDDEDPYEFLWPELRERVWVIPAACRPQLIPNLTNGTLTELDRLEFLSWFERWTREIAQVKPSDSVH